MQRNYTIKWLINKFEEGHTLKFIYFWGNTNKLNDAIDKSCLSQWFESSFMIGGIIYKTAEHWMMAQKALLFNDKVIFDEIIACQKPAQAKELGRKVIGYDEQTWNDHKVKIIKAGNIHKFNQNTGLANYLINTADRILVEASPVDTIWGIGLSQNDDDITNIYAWRGENLLGFALMEVRDFLKGFGQFKPLDSAMLSPWVQYQGIDAKDMFWRMGKGEDYLLKFIRYYDALSERDKTIYQLLNPAPYNWADFYNG